MRGVIVVGVDFELVVVGRVCGGYVGDLFEVDCYWVNVGGVDGVGVFGGFVGLFVEGKSEGWVCGCWVGEGYGGGVFEVWGEG